MTTTKTRGRLQLVIVALIFFGPLAVAAWLYYGPAGWRPGDTTNRGELLQPVVALGDSTLDTAVDAPLFKGHWSLIYLERGRCDAACQDRLVRIRQIRLATGSEADRVQRVFLSDGPMPDPDWLAAGHAGLITARPARDTVFAARIEALDSGFFIADPLGNLILSYPLSTQAKPIYEDLKKLLRNSRIG